MSRPANDMSLFDVFLESLPPHCAESFRQENAALLAGYFSALSVDKQDRERSRRLLLVCMRGYAHEDTKNLSPGFLLECARMATAHLDRCDPPGIADACIHTNIEWVMETCNVPLIEWALDRLAQKEGGASDPEFLRISTLEDGVGMFCLRGAIASNNETVLRLLLSRGADPNMDGIWGRALGMDRAHLLPLLFEAGASMGSQEMQDCPPLYRWVMEAGCDIHRMDEPGFFTAIDFLLARGADPDEVWLDKISVRDFAISQGYPGLIPAIDAAAARHAARELSGSTQSVLTRSPSRRI